MSVADPEGSWPPSLFPKRMEQNWQNVGIWLNIYQGIASLRQYPIVRFTLNSSTRIIEFRGFLSQFSTNFHEILHTLFSIHVVTTLKVS